MIDYIKIGFLFALISSLCIACQPDSGSSIYLQQGRILINAGNYDKAIEVLRSYVHYHKKDYEAHILLGKCFMNVDKEDKDNLYRARYYFKNAIDLAADKKQKKEAEAEYNRARSLSLKKE